MNTLYPISENIAYLSNAITSTSARTTPQNAIDENDSSYFWTYKVNNPQLTLTLTGIFNIRYIYVDLYMGTVNNILFNIVRGQFKS